MSLNVHKYHSEMGILNVGKFSEGGIFNCKLIFPPTYPERPPKMKFTTPIWHPNVYTNGDVCISILHEPGEDAFNPQARIRADDLLLQVV